MLFIESKLISLPLLPRSGYLDLSDIEGWAGVCQVTKPSGVHVGGREVQRGLNGADRRWVQMLSGSHKNFV